MRTQKVQRRSVVGSSVGNLGVADELLGYPGADVSRRSWYPLIDRKKGMYMQIAQSVVVGLNATNPGCEGATYLRIQVKPFVDRALGHPLDEEETVAGEAANAKEDCAVNRASMLLFWAIFKLIVGSVDVGGIAAINRCSLDDMDDAG